MVSGFPQLSKLSRVYTVYSFCDPLPTYQRRPYFENVDFDSSEKISQCNVNGVFETRTQHLTPSLLAYAVYAREKDDSSGRSLITGPSLSSCLPHHLHIPGLNKPKTFILPHFHGLTNTRYQLPSTRSTTTQSHYNML